MLYAIKKEPCGWSSENWLEWMLEDADIIITGNDYLREYNTDNEQWDKLFGWDECYQCENIDALFEIYRDEETDTVDVLEMLNLEFPRNDERLWTAEDAKEFELLYENEYVFSRIWRCELLNFLFGGNWHCREDYGYQQREWNYFYYNTEEKNGFRVTKEYIKTVVSEYFGMYDEWIVGEPFDKEYNPTKFNMDIQNFVIDKCDHQIEHTYGAYGYDTKDVKRELAQINDVSVEEIVIFEPYEVLAYKMV